MDHYTSPQKRADDVNRLHLSSQAIMTPPHQDSHALRSLWNDQSPSELVPESRHRTGAIPRSHAFASLAPLSKFDHFNSDDTDDIRHSVAPEGAMKRTISLHQAPEMETTPFESSHQWRHRERSAGSSGSGSSSVNGIEHAARPGPSSQPMFQSSSNEDQEEPLDLSSRHFKLPTFLPPADFGAVDDVDMGFDDDDASARPPPSPTPFGDHATRLPSSGSDAMDLGEVVLQPGVRHIHRLHRRTCSSVTSSASSHAASLASTHRSHAAHSSISSTSDITNRRRSSTSATADSIDDQIPRHPTKPHPPANRARASSSAALHRPLTEFLTPRSTSASALLGEKLPSVANLFEFATQPRPVIRSSSREHDVTPLRDTKRRSSGTPLGAFATGKLFENEIQAVKSAKLDPPASDMHRALDASTPVRRGPKSRLDYVQEDRSESYSPAFDTPQHLLYSGLQAESADDSGVAFADESAKSHNKFTTFAATHLSRDSPLLGPARRFRSYNMPESPAIIESSSATPARQTGFQHDSPAPRHAAMLTNPFGPKERSSLARETSFGGSSENGSMPPSPEGIPRARSKTVTTTSPVRKARDRRPTSEAVDGHNYMTPQNFRSIKPLQAAFMSTGLVSKRNRMRENSEGSNGAEAFAMPAKPNFGHALGLREVVAAASAHAAAASDRPNHAMPDTPVKKSSSTTMIPFAKAGSTLRPPTGIGASLGPSPLATASLAHDSLSSQASPISPLLPDSCDSPTLNLMPLSPPNASTPADVQATFAHFGRSRRSTVAVPGHLSSYAACDLTEDDGNMSDMSRSPSLQSGRVRDTLKLQKGRKGPLKPLTSLEVASSRKALSVNTLKAAAAPKSLRVRSAGLGRKRLNPSSSFGESDSQSQDMSNDSFAPSTPVTAVPPQFLSNDGMVPMTPTRSAAQIKWFEAAQVVTTPSPSSRRHAVQKLRAHRLELMQNRSKSRLSETSTSQDTPMKAGHGYDTSGTLTPWASVENNRLENLFIVEETIGSGEFSEVVKAVSRSAGLAYAVKRMKKAYSGPKDRLRRLEEVDVLRQLSTSGKPHPNIVSLFDAWEEEGHLFLQLELCPLGSLAFFLEEYGQQVGALDEPRLWKVAAELSSGLAHIHGHGILHLDLKPANILITEHGSLKIGDFGMATRWPPADAETILKGAAVGGSFPNDLTSIPGDVRNSRRGLEREGDREYLAPEVIFQGQYGKAADIFSLGLILLEAAGNVELPDNGEPWQKLRRDDFSDVDLSALSGPMLRLLESLLSSEPERRPTIEEIVEMPVMETVRNIMSRGLSASEMDQLPEFSESSTSGSLALLAESASTQSMHSDSSYHNTSFGSSETDSSMLDLSESGSALGLSDLPSSASVQTSISTSASSYSASLLKVRGALIQEPEEEFLYEVTASDAVEQRLRAHNDAARGRQAQPSSSMSSMGSSIGSPTTFQQRDLRARRPLASVQPFELGPPSYHHRSKAFPTLSHEETDHMDLDG